MIATKRQQCLERNNNDEKATTGQLKRCVTEALKSPESGPQQGHQAARGSATARRWGRPGREIRIGVRLPANHDETAGEVAKPNSVLDLRVLCGTSDAEAPCGLNGRLPDAHVIKAAVSRLPLG